MALLVIQLIANIKICNLTVGADIWYRKVYKPEM